MKQSFFAAVLEKEGSEFVALCPEEVQQRLHNEVFVTRFEAAYA